MIASALPLARAAARVLAVLLMLVPAVALGQGRICIDRDTIVFGDRPIGTSSAATATVRSCGTAAFRFIDVSRHPATGPGFDIDTTCATGSVLAPNASCTVTVRFAPTSAGQQSGALWLRNDTSTPAQLITFYGRGTGPAAGASALAFAPSTLQLGTAEVGVTSAPVRLDLRNVGPNPIVPSALVLNGPGAYDLQASGDCAVGRAIPAGGSCQLYFTFTPAEPGWRLANLVVDAPQLASLAILQIAGTGVASATPPPPPAAPPSAPPAVDIVEFYHGGRDGYFLTADAAEAALLDRGGIEGWVRTGRVLRGWEAGASAPAGVEACRFFGTPNLGPDSHFYTIDAAECAAVRANPYWQYEGAAFRLLPLVNGGCGEGTLVVRRLYKAAATVTALRHRYVTREDDLHAMAGAGWIVEGPVFCTAP